MQKPFIPSTRLILRVLRKANMTHQKRPPIPPEIETQLRKDFSL